MPVSLSDRKEAARMALDDNSAESPIPGKAYGPWKMHPEKGWVQEATEGGVTIYKPWTGPEGSSPMNPTPGNQTDPGVANKPPAFHGGVLGGIAKTLLSPIGFVADTIAANKKALGR